MYANSHITHTLLFARARQEELLREARRFQMMKQESALRNIGRYPEAAARPNRLRRTVGKLLIEVGQRVQGSPQPNFAVHR